MEAAALDQRHRFCAGIRDLFESFAGQRIEGASCIEMAFCGEDTTPVFRHPDLPFVQALVLELRLSGAGRVRVGTWMDDDARWGLLAERAGLDASGPGMAPAFRFRALAEVPRARVEDVRLRLADTGLVSEVRLQLPGTALHLLAGEVEEDAGGRLTVRRDDESVLIALGDAARDRIPFHAPG